MRAKSAAEIYASNLNPQNANRPGVHDADTEIGFFKLNSGQSTARKLDGGGRKKFSLDRQIQLHT
ncbi:hypothetical protein JCGZ_20614 [Jatropha curcas]|uniref:Uncharacterized protein n=1 Tax=Jatropha curcas TaxID=180498 RepID=A0A067JRK5_JATCU|nr:hypothetical protein JCGZ_20614 [Jatropha curcas]